MKPIYLTVSWSVRFSVAGFTLGNYKDHKSIQLPTIFGVAVGLTQPHEAYVYHDHGIAIAVVVSDKAA